MGNKTKDVLIDWAINFIRSKDAITGILQNIEKDKEGFDIKATHSNKEEFIIVEPFIKKSEDIINKLQKDRYITIFVMNSYENFKFLIDNWKRLIDFQKLTIYFVNMFSHTDKKWAIKPYLHDLITNNKSLKEGLNSLFVTVEPLTEEYLEGKVYKE